MSGESIGIALSVLTLVVIAATAVAAIVQLRHLRASNQLSALLGILDQWNQPAFQSAYSQFHQNIAAKLADPTYQKLLRSGGSPDRGSHPELLVFDFWEQVGTYCKHGLIDENIFLDIVSAQVSNAWKRACPAIELIRVGNGDSACENFEYLAVRSELYSRKHAGGSYPPGLPRFKELGGG
jgi:hypothetical protein